MILRFLPTIWVAYVVASGEFLAALAWVAMFGLVDFCRRMGWEDDLMLPSREPRP